MGKIKFFTSEATFINLVKASYKEDLEKSLLDVPVYENVDVNMDYEMEF